MQFVMSAIRSIKCTVFIILSINTHAYCTIKPQKYTSSPLPELIRKLIHSIQRLHNMLKLNHSLPLPNRKTMRSPTRILNLPSVDIPLRKFLDLLGGDGLGRVDLGDERRPDLFFGFLGELLEVQGDVDAREEGFVESFDAVRREEEDAAVVFHMSEAVISSLVNEKNQKKGGRLTTQQPWHSAQGHVKIVVQGTHQPHQSTQSPSTP